MKIISKDQILFFKNQEIIRFESVAGRTRIHFVSGTSLGVDASLNNIEQQLIDTEFIRLHEDHLVNVNFITRISNGPDDVVALNTGLEIPVTGSQKEMIIKLISNHLHKLKNTKS